MKNAIEYFSRKQKQQQKNIQNPGLNFIWLHGDLFPIIDGYILQISPLCYLHKFSDASLFTGIIANTHLLESLAAPVACL